MLYKVDPLRYPDFIAAAAAHDCGRVYPLSIAEGVQTGEIFTDSAENGHNVLFWTYCGFAYLSGKADEGFLGDIYKRMLDSMKTGSRRFVLMTKAESVEEYFRSRRDILVEKRYLFKYSENRGIVEPVFPAGYELREIDEQLLGKISGRITPALFWESARDFLAKGKGYCITHNQDIASWAFSAAVSSGEIDIGVETNPQYKQRGLGSIAVQRMIRYTIGQGKAPVWACYYKNSASQRMAEKAGFVKVSECSIIKGAAAG